MSYVSRSERAEAGFLPDMLPPAIVIGSSAAARDRGVGQIEAAGLRLAAAVSVEDAVERLAQQARASAVWVEIDRDDGPALDHVLNRVDRDAEAGDYGAIIAIQAPLIDAVSARLMSQRVELLVEDRPGEDEGGRAAALALAISRPPTKAGAAEAATDGSAALLRQLTEEVGRIAATLARLSTGPAPSQSGMIGLKSTDSGQPASPPAELTPAALRAVIRARRLRSRYFDGDLFADPAWDMLLDLTQAELTHVRVPVSSLCIAAAVPATTALRWIKSLTDAGLFLRRADPHDGRRVFIEMAATTSEAMRRYFAEVASPVGA